MPPTRGLSIPWAAGTLHYRQVQGQPGFLALRGQQGGRRWVRWAAAPLRVGGGPAGHRCAAARSRGSRGSWRSGGSRAAAGGSAGPLPRSGWGVAPLGTAAPPPGPGAAGVPGAPGAAGRPPVGPLGRCPAPGGGWPRWAPLRRRQVPGQPGFLALRGQPGGRRWVRWAAAPLRVGGGPAGHRCAAARSRGSRGSWRSGGSRAAAGGSAGPLPRSGWGVAPLGTAAPPPGPGAAGVPGAPGAAGRPPVGPLGRCPAPGGGWPRWAPLRRRQVPGQPGFLALRGQPGGRRWVRWAAAPLRVGGGPAGHRCAAARSRGSRGSWRSGGSRAAAGGSAGPLPRSGWGVAPLGTAAPPPGPGAAGVPGAPGAAGRPPVGPLGRCPAPGGGWPRWAPLRRRQVLGQPGFLALRGQPGGRRWVRWAAAPLRVGGGPAGHRCAAARSRGSRGSWRSGGSRAAAGGSAGPLPRSGWGVAPLGTAAPPPGPGAAGVPGAPGAAGRPPVGPLGRCPAPGGGWPRWAPLRRRQVLGQPGFLALHCTWNAGWGRGPLDPSPADPSPRAYPACLVLGLLWGSLHPPVGFEWAWSACSAGPVRLDCRLGAGVPGRPLPAPTRFPPPGRAPLAWSWSSSGDAASASPTWVGAVRWPHPGGRRRVCWSGAPGRQGGEAVREGRGPGTPRRLAGGPHGTGLGVQGAAAAQRAPFTGEDRGRAARGPAGVGGALPGRTLVPGRDPAPPASWGGRPPQGRRAGWEVCTPRASGRRWRAGPARLLLSSFWGLCAIP